MDASCECDNIIVSVSHHIAATNISLVVDTVRLAAIPGSKPVCAERMMLLLWRIRYNNIYYYLVHI